MELTAQNIMFNKILTILCVLTAGLFSISGFAQAESNNVKITPTRLTDQIYMLTGKGGNIGLCIGEDGTFLIDDQFAPLTPKILAAIKSVGGEQPRFLINTHFHGDHTGGNENIGRKGTLIFAHNNVRERLGAGSFIQEFKKKRPALNPEGLPVITFSEDISFHMNNDTIHAIHVPAAHTDGDSFIHFEKSNIIHTGDVFFNGFYPFIDVQHGGSLKGMIKAVDKILLLADDSTKIIPGHGPLADKAQLISYRKMLQTAFERLRKLKAEGKTAKEAAEMEPLEDLDETWGDGLFETDRWIEIIYSGV